VVGFVVLRGLARHALVLDDRDAAVRAAASARLIATR
jgi:hypothetical protein